MELTIRDFNIDIFKLSNAEHNFQFNYDESFFKLFQDSFLEKGSGNIEVKLIKNPTLITLIFNINGNIELTCDRTLRTFLHPIVLEKELILKFGDQNSEITDEIEIIHWDTQTINITQYIYEFIVLEIPMRKLHPEINIDSTAINDELIYTTEEKTSKVKNQKDPRWDALKVLKSNLDNNNL